MNVLIPLVTKLFRGDQRRVMKQNLRGYGIFHNGSINTEDWIAHFNGHVSAAVYLLNENSKCSTICFDVDIPKLEIPENLTEREKVKKEKLLPLVRKITDYLITIYQILPDNFLVEDTGGRGYHIWLFFEEEQDGLSVVNFLNEVKIGCELPELEVFPPGNTFGKTGFSKSLVRLPLGVHRKYNNARSVFISLVDFSIIKYDLYPELLERMQFVDPSVLELAAQRYAALLSSRNVSYNSSNKITKASGGNLQSTAPTFIGTVGEMPFLCPAINGLINKAEKEHDLSHNERFVLAAILKNYEDGEETLHKILANCSNYDKDKSAYQLKSIQPSLLSCKTLQSIKYNICPGWCNSQFADDYLAGKNPSPVWLSQLNSTKESITADFTSISLIQQVASLNNLHHAWKQALRQSVDRDMFEDKLAFSLFEEDLWNNLEMLHFQLINNQWKHNNFLLLNTPKNKEENTFRPFCSVSPREAIVELAILNIIGPPIDSLFSKNSLGNRLAISPKVDSQIFLDWRKQNRIREYKKKGFADLEEGNHYVITDLTKFYEFIKHDKLLAILKLYVDDQQVLSLVQQYVEAPWERSTNEYGGTERTIGIPQGPALSALLANLYLVEVDEWLEDNTVEFVRYVDDIVMVFDSKELAVERLIELEAILSDLGLTISKEKTTAPTPVSDDEKLTNWLDEIRYDFVKSTKTNTPLTELEKFELFSTLQRLAGDVSKDIKAVTRYLGLYIRFTQRLDDKAKLKTVYATAAYLLIEDRPKHNACCIAVQSLIKACSEIDEDAWQELSSVYQARDDEYFKLLLCQETGKILQENEDVEDPIQINPKIFVFIQAISVNEKHPVAAAAALHVLTELKDAQYYIHDHQTLAFSQNEFLRPRALYYLDQLQKVNDTSLARLSPETLLEFEVFCWVITASGTEALKLLIEKIKSSVIFQLALPLFMRLGILLKENGIADVWNILPVDFKVNIAYYIANKIIAELPLDIDRAAKINAIIKFIIAEQLVDIGKELFRFARYANILPQDAALLDAEQYEQLDLSSIITLPTPAGISLSGPVFAENYYVQRANDENGKPYFFEHIDERELNKIGGSLAQYCEALQRLKAAKMILPSTLDFTSKKGSLIVLIPVDESVVSLYDYIQTKGSLAPEEVYYILEKTVSLLESTLNIFKNTGLGIFAPIPSLHTVYIDSDRNLQFGLVSLTIGSEKRYVGRSGKQYQLQAEDPLIESLGLLFFELVTARCAVEDLIRGKVVDKGSLELFKEGNGILFVEIIRKATRPVISERYGTLRFFIGDTSDWSKLETVILNKEKVSDGDAFLLRALWNLDISINRRVLAEFKGNISILLYAHQMQKAIIGYLIKNDIHRQSWLWETWTVINDNEKYRKHLAAQQAITFGEQIEQKISNYHTSLALSKELNFPLWLYASAVHVELESLRRSLHRAVVKSPQLEEFTACKDFMLDNLSQGISVSVFVSKPNDRLNEAVNVLQDNLQDIFNRLDTWLKSPNVPQVNWIHDNLLITLIVIGKLYGLTFVTNDGETVGIRQKKKLFNKIDYSLFLQELLSALKSDIANNGKDKPANGMKYALFVQGRLKDVNIQLLRDVHRYFDVLGSTIYMKFKLKDTVLLKVRSLKKPFIVSKDIIIEENHNHEDYSLSEGCPYSLDVDKLSRKQQIPLTASFPIIRGKWQDEKLYPIYAEERFSSLNRSRLRYQRRYPISSAFLDFHLLLAFITPILCWIGILIFSQTGPIYGLVLNGIIYVFMASPLIVYLVFCYQRFIKQNPEYQKAIANLLGVQDNK